jgi:ribosome-associated heat shock protein Hsp15
VRLDKYLWFIRLVQTRGEAQGLVAEGRLRVDGRVCEKPSAEVRTGSVLSFPLRDRVRVIRVEALPARRGPSAEARACYTDLSPPSAVANPRLT